MSNFFISEEKTDEIFSLFRCGMKPLRRRKGRAGILFAIILIFLAVISVASVYGFNSYRSSRAFARLREKVLRSTLYVETIRGGQQSGFGSGFFISAGGDVLTNHHVVENASTIRLRTREGKVYEAALHLFDKRNDVAHLKIRQGVDSLVPFLKVRSAPPRKDEEVIVAGAPWGFEQTVSRGKISAVTEDPEQGDFFQITARIAEGSSGGPVADLNGEVVGMSTLIFTFQGGQFNYAVASPVLKEFVTNERGETPQQIRNFKEMEAIRQNPELEKMAREKALADVRRTAPAMQERFPSLDFDAQNTQEPLVVLYQPGILQRREPDPSIHRWNRGYGRAAGLPLLQTASMDSVPLPGTEGFMGDPWGSSAETVKKHVPYLRIFTSRGPNQKILIRTIGLRRAFQCEGIFNVDYVFYDDRMGRIEFVQNSEDERDLTEALIRELTSAYGIGPVRTSDRENSYSIYGWDRGTVRTTLHSPNPDAEKPGGVMSSYLLIVRFDFISLSGAWEGR